MKIKSIMWFILGLVVLASVVGGVWWWKTTHSKYSLPPTLFSPATVDRGDILNKVVENGKLQPFLQVHVKANATGALIKLFVDEGTTVKKGQKLAVIQPGRPGERYQTSLVLSPMDGVVIEKKVEVGDTVTSGLSEYSGGSDIMIVADLASMLVQVQINEVDIHKLKAKQHATVKLDALPDKSFPAKIHRISPVAKTPSGSNINVFDVQVRVDGAHEELRPGMSALVEIITESSKNAVRVPVETVFDDNGQPVVYVVKDKVTEKKSVKVGLSDNDFIEIKEGLAPGDKVSRVRPVEPAAPAGPPKGGGGGGRWRRGGLM